MKNIIERELTIETLQKNLIKANYLQKLCYTFIIIDIFSFTIMEGLKIIYEYDTYTSDNSKEIIIFLLKVINYLFSFIKII